MKGYFIVYFFLAWSPLLLDGQSGSIIINPGLDQPIETLKEKLGMSEEFMGIDQIRTLISIASHYLNVNLDSCLHYQQIIESIFEQEQMLDALATTRANIAYVHFRKMEYAEALEWLQSSQEVIEILDTSGVTELAMQYFGLDKSKVIPRVEGQTNLLLAFAYRAVGNRKIADTYFEKGWEKFHESGRESDIIRITVNRGNRYINDSTALGKHWLSKAINRSQQTGVRPAILSDAYSNLGEIYLNEGKMDSARVAVDSARSISQERGNYLELARSYILKAKVVLMNGEISKAIQWIEQSLDIQNHTDFQQDAFMDLKSDAYFTLAECFESLGDYGRALALSRQAQEIVNEKNRKRQTASTDFHNRVLEENLRIRDEADALEATRNKRRTMAFSLGLLLLGIIGLLLWNGSRQKQKANQRLAKTLSDLKATQAQLIHSEKMASLGELTAGIADEIQNPLNFVNNFSDVSGELLDEVEEEINNDNKTEALEIISDLKENLSKIHHHGDRASSIVKGMLAHSRSGSNEKESTDLNALCDEYIRLAYHGMRAKDKAFNAEYELDLEANLPQLEVVTQEIGRVLLNILNNAFHTVNEKGNTTQDFKPEVVLKTFTHKEALVIEIKDNGIGMSDEVKEKIFQPFFTTKAAGQGTGLGMSISYDIIKAHGGDIHVKSELERGSEFIIKLPLN